MPITQAALEAAVDKALLLAADGDGAIARRQLAERELSLTGRGIPAYDALYRQVAGSGRRAGGAVHG
jgi:hypothetical protein